MGLWLAVVVLQTFLFGNVGSRNRSFRFFSEIFPPDALWSAVFFILVLMSIQLVFRAFAEGLLVFQISQVDFLFPTPIPRRTVLIFKLLKDYLMSVLGIGFMLLMLTPLMGLSFSITGIIAVTAVVFLMITVVNLSHTLNIIFSFRMEELKWAGRLIKSFLYVLLITGVIAFAVNLRDSSVVDALNAVARSQAARLFFLPVAWTTDLVLLSLIKNDGQELMKLGMLAGLAAASFVLLVTRPENIYEPSLGISLKAARLRSAIKRGDTTGIVAERMSEKSAGRSYSTWIPPFGRGAVALVWKNIVVASRKLRTTIIMSAVAILTLVFVSRVYGGMLGGDAPVWLGLVLYVLWFGVQMAQREARAELKQANVLKAMPIAGWKVMLSQAFYHSLLLSSGIWVTLILLALAQPSWFGKLMLLTILGVPSLTFAMVSGASMVVPLYPDLKDPVQNLLSTIIASFVGFVCMFGSVIAAVMLWQLKMPVYVPAVIVAGFNLGLSVVFIAIAGVLYNRFDPTSE